MSEAVIQGGVVRTTPGDWCVGRLDQYWTVTDCKHITATFSATGFPVVSIGEVQSRYVNVGDAQRTTRAFYSILTQGARNPEAKDLIMSRNATVGQVAQVAPWHPSFAMGQDVCLLRRQDESYSADFLQFLLQSEQTGRRMSSVMAGSTFKRINVQQIKELVILFPPPREQDNIAKALSDADDLIVTLERLIAKKQAIKNGMMQQLLTGQTRLPGFTEPWVEVCLGDVATMGSGGTPLSGTPRFYGGGIPWVSISDMTSSDKFVTSTEKSLTSEGLLNSAARRYDEDVVLYAIYASLGECALPVGRVASSQAILGILPGDRLDREFVYYYLCSLKSKVKELGQQGTQSNLNAGMVRRFLIPCPHICEQRMISSILADVDADLGAMDRRLAKAKAVKQGMMQELLTGRTRLPMGEPTDE